MKLIFLLPMILLAFSQTPATAEDQQKPLPKFEEVLPSEKLFNNEPLAFGHTYGFATNKTLKEVGPILLKNLGEGWKLEITPAEKLKETNKGAVVKLEGMGRLIHKDFQNFSIGVTLVKMPNTDKKEVEGFSWVLSIVVVDLAKAAKNELKENSEKPKKSE